MTSSPRIVGCCLLVLLPLAAPSAAQGPSAEAAATLVRLLESAALDAAAAPLPDKPDHFVAALHVPGSQLLVVAGTHGSPAYVLGRIAKREFREVYIDLQATPIRTGRFFVMDLGADGLKESPERGKPFDMMYENDTERTMFDGDWKAQNLDEATYRTRFAESEQRYVRLLQVLAGALQKASPTASTAGK